MPWPKIGAMHYHAYLGLQDKGRAIIGLIVCYVDWLEYLKGWLLGLAQGTWFWSLVVVRMAIELKYRNTP